MAKKREPLEGAKRANRNTVIALMFAGLVIVLVALLFTRGLSKLLFLPYAASVWLEEKTRWVYKKLGEIITGKQADRDGQTVRQYQKAQKEAAEAKVAEKEKAVRAKARAKRAREREMAQA